MANFCICHQTLQENSTKYEYIEVKRFSVRTELLLINQQPSDIFVFLQEKLELKLRFDLSNIILKNDVVYVNVKVVIRVEDFEYVMNGA